MSKTVEIESWGWWFNTDKILAPKKSLHRIIQWEEQTIFQEITRQLKENGLGMHGYLDTWPEFILYLDKFYIRFEI